MTDDGHPDTGAPPPRTTAAAGGRRRAGLPFGRRRRTAASALIAMLVALALGALFNAPAMKKTALELPFGGERSFRLALVDPLATVSHWLFLDRPAELTAVALGKPDPGPDRRAGGRGGRADAHADQGGQARGEGRQAGQAAAGASPAQALQGAPDAPLHRRRLHDGPARHGAHQPLQQDQAHQAACSTTTSRPASCGPTSSTGRRSSSRRSRRFDPGAVAVMFGANDNQAVQTPSGKIYQFGSDGWKKEYRKRVRGRHRPAVPGRRAPRLLDRPAGHARRRRTTTRSG